MAEIRKCSFAFVGGFALILSIVACAPDIHENPNNAPFQKSVDMEGTLIVVGTINGCTAVGKPKPSRWDRQTPVQLFRIDVDIENVLKDDLPRGPTQIFFFRDLGASINPEQLGVSGCGGYVGKWRIGERKIFLLQRDGHSLRTACDTWNSCVRPILTGYHADLNSNSGRQVAHMVVDLFLTKGKGCCTDQQLLQAMEESGTAFLVDREYAIQKMQEISVKEQGDVRESACMFLANYDHPCSAQTDAKGPTEASGTKQ